MQNVELYNVQVINTISKFFNSFDVKDWVALKETLTNQIDYDYTDTRNDIGTVTNEKYVASRKSALHHLKTQHLCSNIEITNTSQQEMTIRLNAVIFRRDKKDSYFNSHVIYYFTLLKDENDSLKISQIKQIVLWHDGNPSIHKGISNAKNNSTSLKN